eukprot:4751050-Prymnesium_polylepis.1
MDVDNSGTISLPEFQAVLERYPDAQAVDVEKVYKAMDPGGSGEVEWRWFLAATMRCEPRALTHCGAPRTGALCDDARCGRSPWRLGAMMCACGRICKWSERRPHSLPVASERHPPSKRRVRTPCLWWRLGSALPPLPACGV